METELTVNNSPQLPLPIVLSITAISAIILILSLRRAGSLQGVYLIVAIWLRVISGAYSSITFTPIIGPLSINALLTVGLTISGILVISMRTFTQKWVVPFYALVAVMFISSIINDKPAGFVDMSLKWIFAVTMIAATREAMLHVGVNRIITLSALCYSQVFVLQFIAVGIGMGKATENDGSVSFIGGYNHEAVFSVMVVTFILLMYLQTNIKYYYRCMFIIFGILSVVLANYRTAIVAMLPLLAGTFLVEGATQFDRKSRSFVIIMLIPLSAAIALLGVTYFSERFSDMGVVITEGDRFFKPTNSFTADDKRVLSGRPYMWMGYINGYLDGTDLQLLFGFGPNGWVGVFAKYAHNTLVSFIYELGASGVLILLYIWTMFIIASFSLKDPVIRLKIILAQFSFILLNFATMPHWQIEGMIMFSVLQGTLLHYSGQSRRVPRSRAFYRNLGVHYLPIGNIATTIKTQKPVSHIHKPILPSYGVSK